MAHETFNANSSSFEEVTGRGLTEKEEARFLHARQAGNLAIAVSVSSDPSIQRREVTRFLQATEYDDSTTESTETSKGYIQELISQLQGKVMTETAAAYKAQNDALRQQIVAIKSALMHQPAEVLLSVADALKLPEVVRVQPEEFVSEVRERIDTNELEAMVNNVTDETVSPPRGIKALSSRAIELFRSTKNSAV